MASMMANDLASTERRQLPRLSLSSIQFKKTDQGKIYSLKDVSEGGMAIWLDESESHAGFKMNSLVEGVLNLRTEKLPVRAKVVSVSADRVNCQFENLSEATLKTLRAFLAPEILGQQLKLYPSHQDLKTLEYHGPAATDLIFKLGSDGRYVIFTIYVLGNFVHWDEERGLSTGVTQSSDQRTEQRGVLRLETLILSQDPSLDPQKLNIAKRLILSSNLPQDTKTWCLQQLSSLNT